MTCFALDVGCQLHKLIDPIWFWLFWGFWAVVALGVLGALYKVKQVFGWPGVVAVLSLGLGALVFKAGRDSVRREEGDMDPPVRPKKPKDPDKPKGPQFPPDIYGQPKKH